MVCITPSLDILNIEQYFIVKGLRMAIASRDAQIKGFELAVGGFQKQLEEAHNQTALQKENYENCQDDKEYLESIIRTTKNKNKFQKAVLWISVPIVVIETGIIAIHQIIKKAP